MKLKFSSKVHNNKRTLSRLTKGLRLRDLGRKIVEYPHQLNDRATHVLKKLRSIREEMSGMCRELLGRLVMHDIWDWKEDVVMFLKV